MIESCMYGLTIARITHRIDSVNHVYVYPRVSKSIGIDDNASYSSITLHQHRHCTSDAHTSR